MSMSSSSSISMSTPISESAQPSSTPKLSSSVASSSASSSNLIVSSSSASNPSFAISSTSFEFDSNSSPAITTTTGSSGSDSIPLFGSSDSSPSSTSSFSFGAGSTFSNSIVSSSRSPFSRFSASSFGPSIKFGTTGLSSRIGSNSAAPFSAPLFESSSSSSPPLISDSFPSAASAPSITTLFLSNSCSDSPSSASSFGTGSTFSNSNITSSSSSSLSNSSSSAASALAPSFPTPPDSGFASPFSASSAFSFGTTGSSPLVAPVFGFPPSWGSSIPALTSPVLFGSSSSLSSLLFDSSMSPAYSPSLSTLFSSNASSDSPFSATSAPAFSFRTGSTFPKSNISSRLSWLSNSSSSCTASASVPSLSTLFSSNSSSDSPFLATSAPAPAFSFRTGSTFSKSNISSSLSWFSNSTSSSIESASAPSFPTLFSPNSVSASPFSASSLPAFSFRTGSAFSESNISSAPSFSMLFSSNLSSASPISASSIPTFSYETGSTTSVPQCGVGATQKEEKEVDRESDKEEKEVDRESEKETKKRGLVRMEQQPPKKKQRVLSSMVEGRTPILSPSDPQTGSAPQITSATSFSTLFSSNCSPASPSSISSTPAFSFGAGSDFSKSSINSALSFCTLFSSNSKFSPFSASSTSAFSLGSTSSFPKSVFSSGPSFSTLSSSNSSSASPFSASSTHANSFGTASAFSNNSISSALSASPFSTSSTHANSFEPDYASCKSKISSPPINITTPAPAALTSSTITSPSVLAEQSATSKQDKMGFFDLNIPYLEGQSGNHPLDNTINRNTRLKVVAKAMELGYTGVAYNHCVRGLVSFTDICSISLFPLFSLFKVSPNLSTSVKFHRELLGVPLTSPFRQYTRLTIVVDSLIQSFALDSGNAVLKTYDLIAVQPLDQATFDHACLSAEVDLIAIDFSNKLPLRMHFQTVKAAIERGIYFEITYSDLISDVHTRREIISQAKLLVEWTRGKNLIFSSAAACVTELRGPYDAVNLSYLLGFSMERAKATISKNCRSLLQNSIRKKRYYNNAIKVERISSTKPANSEDGWFCDENGWDQISSGEGDLLLDTIAKFPSVHSVVPQDFKNN